MGVRGGLLGIRCRGVVKGYGLEGRQSLPGQLVILRLGRSDEGITKTENDNTYGRVENNRMIRVNGTVPFEHQALFDELL